MPIYYVTRKAIDITRWDECITAAGNGVIYGYSHYLDAMAKDWDGLVLDDYKAVMPLPWRKKWGVHYLYQPFLTAQLGVFGQTLTAEIVKSFLTAIPQRFKYWNFPLNRSHVFSFPDYPVYNRQNFILPLNTDYEELQKRYRANIRRNIRKAVDYGCHTAANVDVNSVIELARSQAQEATESDFDNFQKLFHLLKQRGEAKTYGILSAEGALLASAVFFFSHQRAYYILVGNHPNGRTLGASHMLIDAFISDHAGQDLILDFEGSDLRNLAFFYSSFGAKEEPYTAIRLNRLPWWAKWMKK